MSLRPNNAPPVQDMPPKGGYPEINVSRTNLKPRGPSGAMMWGVSSAIIAWGFYQAGQGNHKRNEQKLLERQVHYNMMPLLQAEADRVYLETELVNLKKEAEVMKHMKDHKVGESPYHNTKIWMPRAVAELSRHGQK